MPKIQVTESQSKSGVSIVTGQLNEIEVQVASVQFLIGGPYRDVRGEEHTYGHVALRVIRKSSDKIYDFGRYAGETGPSGQGRLRVWSNFQRYIASENSYGRKTVGFLYKVREEEAEKITEHYESLISGRQIVKKYGTHMQEYRLAKDYQALNNNCATISLSSASLGIKNISHNVTKHNQGRGLSFSEKAAAHLAGWPNNIFMPADLKAMLEENPVRRADKVENFGVAK